MPIVASHNYLQAIEFSIKHLLGTLSFRVLFNKNISSIFSHISAALKGVFVQVAKNLDSQYFLYLADASSSSSSCTPDDFS